MEDIEIEKKYNNTVEEDGNGISEQAHGTSIPSKISQCTQTSNAFSTSNPISSFVDPCKCEVYEKLELEKDGVVIKEATTGYFEPSTLQDTGNFVTYVIELGDWKTRKRYSDFELLAAHLNRIYPHQVIPPIPEKETLTSIISGYTGLKDKHDPFLIQHRTRLFQYFLKNISTHPTLRADHYFHRFIDQSLPGSLWSEGITTIPARLLEGIDPSSNLENNTVKRGKIPDPLINKFEEMTRKYREGIRSIEKGQSKLIRKFKDESNVLSELGASFNAFSLEITETNDESTNGPSNFTTNQMEPINKLTNEEIDFKLGENVSNQDTLKYTNQNTFHLNSTNQIPLNEKPTNQNSPFKKQLEMIGQSSDSEVIHLHSLIRHHELLRDRLKEIILYCGSLLKSLGNLAMKRASLEDFHDQINGRKNLLMQLESSARADEEKSFNLKKLKNSIDELENSKRIKLTEMTDFTTFLLTDIDRVYSYFGKTWQESLKALAECQSRWHEEACKSWAIE